ncbi:MAG: TRAP transporter small permease subunit [Pseudomonadota bacterium]
MADFIPILGTTLRWIGVCLLPLGLLPIAILIAPKRFAGISRHLITRLDGLSGFALDIAIGFSFLIILVQLVVLFLSNVYGVAFSWLSDTVIFSFAGIFMLGAAATLRDEGHVRVDILRPRFSDAQRAIVELVGSLGFIWPIGLLILYGGAASLARSWAGLEPFNESDGLPFKYLFKTLIPAFAVLMMAQGLSQALKAARILRGLDEPPSPAATHTVGPA